MARPRKKKQTPNPNGRNGVKFKIDLPFEKAIKTALEAKPPEKPEKRP